ncbi:hypothetical protein D3C77_643830 [compost metagenome]
MRNVEKERLDHEEQQMDVFINIHSCSGRIKRLPILQERADTTTIELGSRARHCSRSRSQRSKT